MLTTSLLQETSLTNNGLDERDESLFSLLEYIIMEMLMEKPSARGPLLVITDSFCLA